MRLSTRGFARALVAVAAGAAMLAVPQLAIADPIQHDISQGEVQLYAEDGGCPGHYITGQTTDVGNKILVESGEHDITINNVNIDLAHASGLSGNHSPFAIGGNATVNLRIEGTNNFAAHTNWGDLTHAYAAVWVQPGSTLNIDGPGRIVARADDPDTSAQTGAAGIGGGYVLGEGSQSGNITINGGYVQAFGGSHGASSGAGIGAGENGNYIGTITINGGVVRAMGGDADQPSIGGGGHATGELDNGTFTTGTNGNAVIAAPWGIGDTSQVAEWDCILLDATRNGTTDAQFVTYWKGVGGRENVRFDGGVPRVYGDVEVDYNITINSPATLRVEGEFDLDNDPSTSNSNAPSTLTMKSGTTLTNNNVASDPGIAGIALMPGSTLVLEGGTSQCAGNGSMIATSAAGTGYELGKVQLPLSDDMVSVNPDAYVYNGQERKPSVTVSFPKWNFSQAFAEGSEYSVSYADNVNAGTATATATSVGGNLLSHSGRPSTGSTKFTITEAGLNVTSVTRRFVQVGEDQLLSKLPQGATYGPTMPDTVKQDIFSWYSDAGSTTALTDDFVAGLGEGAEATVYWKYEQTDDPNYEPVATGSTTLAMTAEEPPLVQVDGQDDSISLRRTYGEAAYTPTIKIDYGAGWTEPLSDVTYAVVSQQSENGDVVTVSPTGEISFVGAGRATVVETVEAYTDPDPLGDKSYGPAYVTISILVDPAEVAVDPDSVKATDRAYNGTRNVDVTASLASAGIVGDDLVDGLVGVSATGMAATPSVGDDIVVDVVYELAGEKADDYVLTNAPNTKVSISKAQAGADTLQGKTGELTVSNCVAATYAYDLNELVPDSKPVGDGGDALFPGWITFENPVVSISDNRYFDASDIRIDNATHALYLTVNDVDEHVTDQLGTITLDMVSPNFEGMTGTINVMREDMEVHMVTASAGAGGSITPSGAVEVVSGHDQTFAVTADEGFSVDTVTVDGAEAQLEADGTYTFESVTADHTIEVAFKQLDDGQGGTGDEGQSGQDQGGDQDVQGGSDTSEDQGNQSDKGDQANKGDGAASDVDKIPNAGDATNPALVAGVAVAGVAAVAVGMKVRKNY